MQWKNRVDAPQTTQWQDIFDKKAFGKTALEVYEEADALREQAEELVRHQQIRKDAVRRLEEDTSSDGDMQLSEEDQIFMESYKKQLITRIENAQNRLTTQSRGLREVTAEEYAAHTAEGDSIVLIHNNSILESRRVAEMLNRLSERFPRLRMLSIRSTEASKGYPADLCPTLVIYLNGKLKCSLVGKEACGGSNVTMEDLREILGQYIKLQDYTAVSDNESLNEVEKGLLVKLRINK